MIVDRYRSLLVHVGPTVSLTDLRRSDDADRVAMRHDIDHDLGVALDMSAMEREVGERRATYFILHTQDYCQDGIFLDRLRQLVDDGHEIGLHLDAIGAWWRGETDDPFGDLGRWLDRVRGAGIPVVASAAHGAKACYQGDFANHWIWSELRGDDPAATMDGVSAEGIEVSDPAFQLRYPGDHRVRRADGATLDLWSCSMASIGIEYEACTVPVDRYWSDSGGEWKRSPDPAEHDLSQGRHQVLVHPWWWREPRRDILVLGTARSGTKWLCGRFEAGTSALTLHERTLNQDGRSLDPAPGLKRTAGDFVGLLEDSDRVRRLVDDAFLARHRTKRDTVEANVYLPHVDPELLQREGLAIVHLHRDPAKVVRSILERGWYDTADDRRHPRFEVGGRGGRWDEMTRVEQACTYWAETNLHLFHAFPDAIRVAAEDLQSDSKAVRTLTGRLGFAWHPIPAAAEDGPVDRTETWVVPAVEDWHDVDRRAFIDICGPVATMLGRSIGVDGPSSVVPRADATTPIPHVRACRFGRGRVVRCNWHRRSRRTLRDPRIVLGDVDRGASFGLRRGAGWDGGRPRWFAPRLPRSAVLSGRLDTLVRGDAFVGRLFAVEVDRAGAPIHRTPLLRIEPGSGSGRFAVRLRSDAVAVHPVVLVDSASGPWRFEIRRFDWRIASASGGLGPVPR